MRGLICFPGNRLLRLGLVLLCLLPLACFSCSDSSRETVPAQLKVGFAIYDFAYIDPEGACERLTTAVRYHTAMLSPRDSLIIVPCLHPVRPVFSRSDGEARVFVQYVVL